MISIGGGGRITPFRSVILTALADGLSVAGSRQVHFGFTERIVEGSPTFIPNHSQRRIQAPFSAAEKGWG